MVATAELNHAGPRVTGGQLWKSDRPAGLAARVWTGVRCRAERVAGRVHVPADVRTETPLEPGERILLFARDTDGGLVAATERALRHQAAGGWSHHGWEQLTRVAWDDQPARVTARLRPAGEELTWQVSLDDPGAAVDPAVRARLAAAISQLRAHIGT